MLNKKQKSAVTDVLHAAKILAFETRERLRAKYFAAEKWITTRHEHSRIRALVTSLDTISIDDFLKISEEDIEAIELVIFCVDTPLNRIREAYRRLAAKPTWWFNWEETYARTPIPDDDVLAKVLEEATGAAEARVRIKVREEFEQQQRNTQNG
jgi:hypothetical protein